MRTRSDLVEVEGRPLPPIYVAARIIDYLFGLLYALLAIRLVLELINARQESAFYALIRRISDPFYKPFAGIVGTGNVEGYRVVWPLIIAIIAYMILHAAIRGLLRLVARA